MILIDYFSFDNTYQLWDLTKDCKYPARDFKSTKAAKNFCIRRGLQFRLGNTCDG